MKIADLKKDMDAGFERVDRRFEKVDEEFKAVRAEIKASEEATRRHVDGSAEATRRHFDIVAEQLKTEMSLGYEKFDAMQQHIGELIATNAQEHAVFARIFDNHEIRIKVLEEKP